MSSSHPGAVLVREGKASFGFRHLTVVPMPRRSRGGCATRALQTREPEGQFARGRLRRELTFHCRICNIQILTRYLPRWGLNNLRRSVPYRSCLHWVNSLLPVVKWLRKIYHNCIAFVS